MPSDATIKSKISTLEAVLKIYPETEDEENERCDDICNLQDWLAANGVEATLNDDTGKYSWRRV